MMESRKQTWIILAIFPVFTLFIVIFCISCEQKGINDVIDVKPFFVFEDNIKIHSVIKTKDNCLVFAGSKNEDAYFAKIDPYQVEDSNGGLVFSNTYGGELKDIFLGVTETQDGCFALAGYTASTKYDLLYINKNSYFYHSWILKIDLNSAEHKGIVFNRCYEEKGVNSYAYDIVETFDGKLAVLGNIRHKNNFSKALEAVEEPFFIAEIDTQKLAGSDVSFKKYFKFGQHQSYKSAYIIKTDRGGFVAAGTVKYNKDTYNAFILKTDKNGNTISFNEYGKNGKTWIGRILEFEGKTIACGRYSSEGTTGSLIMEDGEILTNNIISDYPLDIVLYDITITKNKEFLVCGSGGYIYKIKGCKEKRIDKFVRIKDCFRAKFCFEMQNGDIIVVGRNKDKQYAVFVLDGNKI